MALRRSIGCLAILLVQSLATVGCSAPRRGPSVPVELIDKAIIPDIPRARVFIGHGDPTFIAELRESVERRRREAGLGPDDALPDAHFLALSGGGSDGAFGAGILCAWTELGTRPEFRAVTGVSTGALIAPFAFLGPEYDPVLKRVYTTTSDGQILHKRSALHGLMTDAMADTTPLRNLIRETVTQKEVDAIARERAKGRYLFVATTNMDSGAPVIWDIGAMAASGSGRARDLICDVLLASASIPVAFPPVLIDVEADGKRYQELHVDGGAAAQVFIYPPEFNLAALSREYGIKVRRSIYVIRNSQLTPWPEETPRKTLSIAGRAVSSLIRTQGVGDIYRIYLESVRDGLDFHLAYIPEDFMLRPKSAFDPKYMAPLFQLGYDRMKSGALWRKAPSGFEGVSIVPGSR